MGIPPIALSLAKWMAYFGLVCGVFYSVGGFFYDLFTMGLNWGTAMAFMALVGMPVIFSTVGFIVGALIACVARGARMVLFRMGSDDTLRGS